MQAKIIIHVMTTIERGGAENAVSTLAIAQAIAGHQVFIFPLKGKDDLAHELIDNGVGVLLEGLNRNPFLQIIQLRRLYAENIIFHAHLPRAEILARIAFGAGNFLITRHNAEKFFPKASPAVSRVLSKWVSRGATVIAISHAVLGFLKDSKEIDKCGRSTVIYYGYKPRSHSHSSKKQNNLTSEYLRFGSISRLVEQKNPQLQIYLTKALIDEGYKVQTSIVGEGRLRNELVKLTQQLHIADHVIFLGKLDDVTPYLESLDLFLLTSNYEGFGLVLLEAMDAGVVIAASQISSIPEVLGSSHPGLFQLRSLQSLMDKVKAFINNDALKKQTLTYQYERLSVFTVEKYLGCHDEVYDSILNSR